jgi:hypothetical protein
MGSSVAPKKKHLKKKKKLSQKGKNVNGQKGPGKKKCKMGKKKLE